MTDAAGVVKGAGVVKVAALAGVLSVGKSGKGGTRACPGAVRRTRCRRCCTRRRGWRRPPLTRRPRLQRPAAGGRHWSRGRHDCAVCAMCAACALHVRCMWSVCAPRCVLPVLVALALVEKKTTALMPANCWKTNSRLEMATSLR